MTNFTPVGFLRTLSRRILITCFAVTLTTAQCEANLFYNFIESASGDKLATLELTSLPATHAEIAGLTFTELGQTRFGFPEIYGSPINIVIGGPFTASGQTSFGIPAHYGNSLPTTDLLFVDDGVGGLAGESTITDRSHYPSTLFYLDDGTSQFELHARSGLGQDEMIVRPQDSAFQPGVGLGNWQFIPEPSSIGLSLTAVLCCGLRMGRQRKSKA